MNLQHAFAWGFAGSLGIEIVDIYEILRAERLDIPPQYKRLGYWVVRVCMAAVGGLLAVATGAQTPYAAMAIGAATPALVRALPYLRSIQREATPITAERKRKLPTPPGENSFAKDNKQMAA